MEVTTILKTGEFHQNEAFDANELNVTDDDGTRM